MGMFFDNCEAPLTIWMLVTEGYDSKFLNQLTADFAAGVKADANNLKVAKAEASINFSSKMQKILEQVSQGTKKAEVSQEFFEKATAYRTALCNLERQIKSGIFDQNPDARNRAINSLIDYSTAFQRIQTNEPKCYEIVSSGTIFNIAEGQYLHTVIKTRMQSKGQYVFCEDLYVGQCIIKKGSTITFNSNGKIVLNIQIKTNHTTYRDIWHLSIFTEDGRQFGPINSPELLDGAPFIQWSSDSTSYSGETPDGTIYLGCGC